MFGDSAGDALSPQPEAAPLKMGAHHLDDIGLRESGPLPDFLEGGSILPGHADDAVRQFVAHLPLPSSRFWISKAIYLKPG